MIDLKKGDCLEVIKEIPNKSVDLIIIDPPYNINYCEFDKNIIDYNILCKEFKRVLKENGGLVVFQGWSNVCKTKEIIEQYFKLKDWIIYDRIKGRGTRKSLVSTREDILWFVNNEKEYTYNKIPSKIKKKTMGMGEKNGCEYRALSNVWTDISPIVPWSKERTKHPTQKPVELLARCIKLWSDSEDVILDCFMGSGTTGVACVNTNRNFIGIELDENYFEIAQNRIEEAMSDKEREKI